MGGVWFMSSYVMLWCLTLATFLTVIVLFRYHATQLVDDRIKRSLHGPEIGSRPAPLNTHDISGAEVVIGGDGREQLVYFASVWCELCRSMMGKFLTFADAHGQSVEIILVVQGDRLRVEKFCEELPATVRAVPDCGSELSSKYTVRGTPFMIALDRRGVVRGKGLIGFETSTFENYLENIRAA
jgi:hypothetical protein